MLFKSSLNSQWIVLNLFWKSPVRNSQCSYCLHRWRLHSSTWSLPSSGAWTYGYRARTLRPHGRPHGDRPDPWRRHHRDGAAGGDVPDLAGADCVSTLSAGHCHPHLTWRGTHEHAVLPLLLLCRVSGDWNREHNIFVSPKYLKNALKGRLMARNIIAETLLPHCHFVHILFSYVSTDCIQKKAHLVLLMFMLRANERSPCEGNAQACILSMFTQIIFFRSICFVYALQICGQVWP